MIKISKEQVIAIHDMLIDTYGGSYGVRDMGLLDSAIGSAFQTFGGMELYATNEEKAARLGYSIVSNHAFIDGNKRAGMLAMLSFLAINGVNMLYTEDELIEIGLGVADGKVEYDGVLEWVNNHKVTAEKKCCKSKPQKKEDDCECGL